MGSRGFAVTARWLARGLVMSGLTLGLAGPVGAAQAEQVRIEIHETFVDEFLTEICGTEVVVSIDASLNVTFRYNRSGLLVAEIAPSSGGTTVLSAPETGASFSFPFNTSMIDYGDGATVGSSFTMRIAGLAGHVPGYLESDAGQLVVTGTVKGFDEEGFPSLDFTGILVQHGNVVDEDTKFAAICAALNP